MTQTSTPTIRLLGHGCPGRTSGVAASVVATSSSTLFPAQQRTEFKKFGEHRATHYILHPDKQLGLGQARDLEVA